MRQVGLSRAWLALSDGQRVDDGVRENYGNLASFLQPYINDSSKTFLASWAQRTFRFVFGEDSMNGDNPGDLDVNILRQRDAEYLMS